MSKAITQKEEHVDDRPRLNPDALVETAPSMLRDDALLVPRYLGGMLGGALVIFGGMALLFHLMGREVWIRPGVGLFIVCMGLCGLLFHAAFDPDIQVRRLYMFFGLALVVIGIGLSVLPAGTRLGGQFHWGVFCLGVALVFLLAFLRNEDQQLFRDLAQRIIGLGGLGMAAVGLIGGAMNGSFFLPTGLVFSLVGLVYLTAFVASRGISDDLAYYAALGVGLLGTLILMFVLMRSLFVAEGSRYFVTYGLVLFIAGLLYFLTGLLLAIDKPLFILTRRELGAFFFSPIAYLALIGFAVACWLAYANFLDDVFPDPREPVPIEPIVRSYLFSLFPVFALLLIVPILTMRLLSEEMRSGTMEVLLTAPVDEGVIVLSKFFATLISFLVLWLPFGLFLMAIPLSGGAAFDYRPLLSFALVLIVTGTGFVSMGLFFSSLTRNQIASAVLTAAGMLLLTYVYFAAHRTTDTSWQTALTHASYLDLWFAALAGKIVPRFLLFWVSMGTLFLFLTVKVLESRKWR